MKIQVMTPKAVFMCYWISSISLNEVVKYLVVQQQIGFNISDFQTIKLEKNNLSTYSIREYVER